MTSRIFKNLPTPQLIIEFYLETECRFDRISPTPLRGNAIVVNLIDCIDKTPRSTKLQCTLPTTAFDSCYFVLDLIKSLGV